MRPALPPACDIGVMLEAQKFPPAGTSKVGDFNLVAAHHDGAGAGALVLARHRLPRGQAEWKGDSASELNCGTSANDTFSDRRVILALASTLGSESRT
jgi:hypothetical protein